MRRRTNVHRWVSCFCKTHLMSPTGETNMFWSKRLLFTLCWILKPVQTGSVSPDWAGCETRDVCFIFILSSASWWNAATSKHCWNYLINSQRFSFPKHSCDVSLPPDINKPLTDPKWKLMKSQINTEIQSQQTVCRTLHFRCIHHIVWNAFGFKRFRARLR